MNNDNFKILLKINSLTVLIEKEFKSLNEKIKELDLKLKYNKQELTDLDKELIERGDY